MRSIALKLITLLAVLLMPLGMQPAAAAPAVHHASTMSMQHCPDPAKPDGKGAFTECTMVCSSALLAADRAAAEPSLIAPVPPQPRLARALHGILPETATPPPKRS